MCYVLRNANYARTRKGSIIVFSELISRGHRSFFAFDKTDSMIKQAEERICRIQPISTCLRNSSYPIREKSYRNRGPVPLEPSRHPFFPVSRSWTLLRPRFLRFTLRSFCPLPPYARLPYVTVQNSFYRDSNDESIFLVLGTDSQSDKRMTRRLRPALDAINGSISAFSRAQ